MARLTKMQVAALRAAAKGESAERASSGATVRTLENRGLIEFKLPARFGHPGGFVLTATGRAALDAVPTGTCVAHFSKRGGMRLEVIITPCSRPATEKVGTIRPLALCAAHARMAREGFVDPNGNVESPATVADCRRYGITPPWSWAKESK